MTIVTAAAQSEDVIAFAMVIDELAEDPQSGHAAIYVLEVDTVRLIDSLEYSVVSVAYSDAGPMTLGDWGKFKLYNGDTGTEETIPVKRGPLRGLGWIGGRAFSCGAAMQVWRRDAPESWTDISPPEDLRTEFDNHIFEAIDGFATDEVYVAGDFGVIWYWDGSAWDPIQCASNACFYAIHCASDGYVYAAGQAGTVARGRRSDFEILYSDPDIIDLWSVDDFDGEIYFAGYTALFQLDFENELTLIPEPLEFCRTYGVLSSAEGVLWSVGEKDVMIYDRDAWLRYMEVDVA
ncbi:hypothetical protein ABMC89_17305 [Sulfitobacter sp. HNIBRBA3233]|uniref:hypothetical protein n=1 Tax=Sulfitobacter marinivivus TaxID=3158558 RepID=UPI0032DFE788